MVHEEPLVEDPDRLHDSARDQEHGTKQDLDLSPFFPAGPIRRLLSDQPHQGMAPGDHAPGGFQLPGCFRLEDLGAEDTGTEFLCETLSRVRARLAADVALIGFCGAPWTLASYLVEGTTSRTFGRVKAFALHHPESFDRLVDHLADAMADYLRQQVLHGAQAVQVFDSWIGALGIEDARRWALRPARRLLERVSDLGVPTVYFAHGGSHLLHDLPSMPCDVIGLDWRADLDLAARVLPAHAVQGNLDPGVLMGPDDEIRRRTLGMLERAPRTGYIANLGHGITPDIPVRAVETFVKTVQEYRYE